MNISRKSRELYDKLAKGWDTWDIQSVTAHVCLPERLRLNVAFVIPHMAGYSGNSLWKNAESFGEHAADGSYTEVDIRYMDGLYKIQTAACGRELLIRITPIEHRYDCYVMLEAGGIWGSNPDMACGDNRLEAASGDQVFEIRSLNRIVKMAWDPSTLHNIACDAADAVYFTVNSKKNKEQADIAIEAARRAWQGDAVSAEGIVGEGLAALRRSLLWNKVYEPRNGRVITPVSRQWCKFGAYSFGDYVLFGWDTFFAAMQYGLISKDLAYSTMFSILEEITEEGMVPNFGSAVGKSFDRSEPQVGALCAWKLYVQFGDKWFIEECFDRLLAWNRWRFRERDCNGDGLLELASLPGKPRKDDEIWSEIEFGKRQGAMWESGMDNSTMWDQAVFNDEKHCLELSYVGDNALLAADCELLEKMAVLLEREDEKRELEFRKDELKAKIDVQLWDEQAGSYLNRHWSGKFDPCMSLTHFYPLAAGIPDREKAAKIIKKHLLNPDEFWGEYIIPNISRDDPSFLDQNYWRGRIWGPTNFLVGEGLLRYGEWKIFEELARKGLAMFMNCWTEKGVVGENYNAITGEAAEKGTSSDKFYHWGALLVYMAVECAINFNEWNDVVEYGKCSSWNLKIKNLPIGNKKWIEDNDASYGQD
jgi:putative isomerase